MSASSHVRWCKWVYIDAAETAENKKKCISCLRAVCELSAVPHCGCTQGSLGTQLGNILATPIPGFGPFLLDAVWFWTVLPGLFFSLRSLALRSEMERNTDANARAPLPEWRPAVTSFFWCQKNFPFAFFWGIVCPFASMWTASTYCVVSFYAHRCHYGVPYAHMTSNHDCRRTSSGCHPCSVSFMELRGITLI